MGRGRGQTEGDGPVLVVGGEVGGVAQEEVLPGVDVQRRDRLSAHLGPQRTVSIMVVMAMELSVLRLGIWCRGPNLFFPVFLFPICGESNENQARNSRMKGFLGAVDEL